MHSCCVFFSVPRALWSLNKHSGCAFGLANDSTKPLVTGKKTGMPGSPDFIPSISEKGHEGEYDFILIRNDYPRNTLVRVDTL